MFKSFCRWLLPLFLLPSIETVASAATVVPANTLLSVVYDFTDIYHTGIRHSSNCTIQPLSVVISHSRTIPSGTTITSTETKKVKVNVASLKSLIDKAAALGVIPSYSFATKWSYFAYQQQANLTVKKFELGAGSELPFPSDPVEFQVLTGFVDSVCGDISK